MSARITIDGNLTADPDFGVSTAGTSWARLRVASHDRVKRNGEWVSTDPEFFNVTLFGREAEDAANQLMKGDRVTVEGRPELELFDRRDGSTGATIKVYARSCPLIVLDDNTTGRTGGRGTGPAEPQPNPASASASAPTIHHTSDATVVVGVGRTATALHRTLKDHGFRWSSNTGSWNLPKDMDEHTRAARVSDVLSVVRENGRDIPVIDQPAPGAEKSPAATAGVATLPGPRAGRDQRTVPVTTAPVNGFDPHAAGDESDRHRHFAANVQQILREDYRLRADETQLAFGRYLRRQTRWVTPDEAAYDAYRWWTPTVDPTVVLAREAEQLAHARTQLHDIASKSPDPELAGDDADRPRRESVEVDIAAAESALAMVRGQGQRHGFTGDHAQLVGELRQVLDESAVWDTITPDDQPERVDLEPALRPESVRPGDDWDDMIVIDAAFAGTTITVMRPPGQVHSSSYVFMTLEPGKRSIMQAADLSTMGMVAAGDRQAEPSRADEYERLGKQVRNHLIGLVDAVADARELRSEQEGRRLHAAQATLGSPVEAAYQRPQPTRGTGR